MFDEIKEVVKIYRHNKPLLVVSLFLVAIELCLFCLAYSQDRYTIPDPPQAHARTRLVTEYITLVSDNGRKEQSVYAVYAQLPSGELIEIK